MTAILETSVQYLKGVGPGRGKLLERLGIITLRDLLAHYPREYDDRRRFRTIGSLRHGERACIRASVVSLEVKRLKPSLSALKVAVSDATGTASLVFYRKVNPYHRHDVFGTLRKNFTEGVMLCCAGTVEENFLEKQIVPDDVELEADGVMPPSFGRVIPVYPLTEGVTQKWLRRLISDNLERGCASWPEYLGDTDRKTLSLPDAARALRDIHAPADPAAAESARRRLAFDEFLLLELALTLARSSSDAVRKPWRYEIKRSLLTPFREKLGFPFTAGQKHVINEIFSDMCAPGPMHRLLMGDVGSGKTIVALSAMLLAVENGTQAALLAPTEILAEQHFLTISRFLAGLPVTMGMVSGRTSSKKAKKRAAQSALSQGEWDIVVGTHALLEDDITFRNLSLAVIDEQHRFGVLQRAALRGKTVHPDILLMTATPIPRSLALTVYGDMNVSTIPDLPPGRTPVRTLHLSDAAAYHQVREEVRKGRQAFIVYPLIEESDKVELKAAVQEAEDLSTGVFLNERVGLLHGRMKREEKDTVMTDFRSGKFDILISTTVIEVGIDVPNATLMVIEHADRFGLATLHQLRGRVGRGQFPSTCILLGDPRSDDARRRFQVMITETSGFRIAEEDLSLRGPGEFFGTAQHGLPLLKAGNLLTDQALIESAKDMARKLVSSDPALSSAALAPVRTGLRQAFGARLALFHVG